MKKAFVKDFEDGSHKKLKGETNEWFN
jgi:hypothetical protein